jgi:YVTN family beta-propeller protein
MEFAILGPLEARDGHGVVRLGARKQRAVLGVLLLNANEVVSTARLVDELWGDSPPATAEKLVQGYVHALRKALSDEIVQTQAPGYRLSLDGGSLDLLEFERLLGEARVAPLRQAVELRRRALALWRGAPLEDIVFEGSARNAVAGLCELRLVTRIEQLDAELELGRDADLVVELETLVAAHPYQERLQAQLMLALYRAGRQAEALDRYRSFRRRLDYELGLQPGQELRDLEAAILRQDAGLSSGARRDFGPVAASAQAQDDSGAPARARWTHWLPVAAAAAAVSLAVLAVAALARDESAVLDIEPNSLALIDPSTGELVDVVAGLIRPGPIASGAGSVWVGNLDDGTLARIDPGARQVVDTISLPATPDAIAFGHGAVWVAHGRLGTLSRVDPRFGTRETIRVAGRAISFPTGGVATGLGAVWAAYGDSTLARVEPGAGTPRRSGRWVAGGGPAGVVTGFGSVWVASAGDATVRRFDPRTFEEGPLREYTVGRTPTAIAAGAGAIWVALREDDAVTRIEPNLGSGSARAIEVGDGPTGVAVGEDAVWVASSADGTISRIDPRTNEVAETIEVGAAPSGVALVDGLLWVGVQAP